MFPKKKKRRTAGLIQIDDKLVSEDVKDEFFICDLVKCKGVCCVEGDLGAPLEKSELGIMEEVYPAVEPYMREEGKEAVRKQGPYLKDFTGEWSTPLVNGKECAYVTFNDQGIALCAIEQAWSDGKISWQKPISCHLYPIRVKKFQDFEALNYDRWDICSPACEKGASAGVRVYEFLKGPIVRKYGEEFYQALDEVIQQQLKADGK